VLEFQVEINFLLPVLSAFLHRFPVVVAVSPAREDCVPLEVVSPKQSLGEWSHGP